MKYLHHAPPVDMLAANLFLHHFDQSSLRMLLTQSAAKSQAFAACEPRRVPFPWMAGTLVRLIGCGPVTRHDAIASVRGGFVSHELSDLWPGDSGWDLDESEAGIFSHAFWAARR
jgi:hypothetical protein